MATVDKVGRQSCIINKLMKKPSTFKEIKEHLQRQSELKDRKFDLTIRTFQRDIDEIYTTFATSIVYDKKSNCYCIEETEDNPYKKNRLLEAYDTFNMLNMGEDLSHYIDFERIRPRGTEHLFGLLHAIKNKLQIRFHHQKFEDETITNRLVEPYSLKEFDSRWYLICKDLNDKKIKTFALDRMTELDITKSRFIVPTDFSLKEMFRYSFGIITPRNEQPETIILSFDSEQAKYIKSLPLHHTQEILLDNDEELQIKLELWITHDFEMKILSYGASVKVIRPIRLANRIKAELQRAANQYKNEDLR